MRGAHGGLLPWGELSRKMMWAALGICETVSPGAAGPKDSGLDAVPERMSCVRTCCFPQEPLGTGSCWGSEF